jgi:thiol-disulfide isomerase/thioredoxin
MRILLAPLMLILCASFSSWETNFDKAKQQALQEHKAILLNFSGSDWCGPCIKLHNEVFESAAFKTFANKNLVLVNADFPRQKKNQLPKPLQQQNEKLADTYNAAGNFPSTILIGSDGKIWKVWDGYPKMSIEDFIADIQKTIDANK